MPENLYANIIIEYTSANAEWEGTLQTPKNPSNLSWCAPTLKELLNAIRNDKDIATAIAEE